jgi:20S proteasome alpha/beta subunit
MSLGIVVKGPEGLVLAADSRVTLEKRQRGEPSILVNFDNATKLLSFGEPNTSVGVVTYGQAAIGLKIPRTAYSFISEFEEQLPEERLSIEDFAKNLSGFFMRHWKAEMPKDYAGPNMTFVVGGFNDGEPYGRVYLIEIPKAPSPVEQNDKPGEFGITWGGQREFVDRLLQGYDHRLPELIKNALHLKPAQMSELEKALRPLQMSTPVQMLALQDCVDLAIFFLHVTIEAQELSVGVRGVGGDIDVATVTRREGLQFVQRKKIVGEISE